MVPSSLCEKGRHTAQSIPSATKRISEKRSRAGTVLALVRHTCTPLVPRAGVGWGGKQTKRVTRRADAKGGCPRSSKPSQVAPGANKTAPRCGCPLRLAQRSLPCAVPRFPHRFVQANCPQGAFGQMGENREDQGGGAPWQREEGGGS